MSSWADSRQTRIIGLDTRYSEKEEFEAVLRSAQEGIARLPQERTRRGVSRLFEEVLRYRDVVEELIGMAGGGDAVGRRGRAVYRRDGRAAGKSQQADRESTSGLSALRKAVAYRPKTAEKPATVRAAAVTDSFPLDDQFKEF